MKKALHKSAWREIKQSKARFFSILGIIFLGVAFFAGISATGPDMLNTANHYYEKYDLYHMRVLSTLGLNDKDLDLIKKDEAVAAVEPRYTSDINLSAENQVVRFVGYDEKNTISQFRLVEGHLPEKDDEIVLDQAEANRGDFKLGDTYTVEESKETEAFFKRFNFKVVGFANSPEYIENYTRGNTTVGKGSVDYFAVVPVAAIKQDTYTELLIRFKDLTDRDGYGTTTEKKLAAHEASLKKLLADRGTERLQEIKDEAETKLKDARKEIADGEKKLADAEEKLQASEKELSTGEAELAQQQQVLDDKIADGQAQLNEQKDQLAQSRAQLNEKQQELANAEAELKKHEADIEKAKGTALELGQQQKAGEEGVAKLKEAAQGYQAVLEGIKTLAASPEEQFAENAQVMIPTWLGVIKMINPEDPAYQTAEQLLQAPDPKQLPTLEKEVNASVANITQQTSEAEAGVAKIEAALAQIQQQLDQFDTSQKQLADGKKQLAAGQSQLESGAAQLTAAENELEAGRVDGQAQLDEAAAKLAEGRTEYEEGKAAFEKERDENLPKLREAKAELEKQEKELDDMKPAEYFYFDRSDNPGYSEYSQNADRIAAIATVFPVFFFVIAALVSLTTMTRMVEEKRGEIGTFKALGYRNGEIAQKYILYASIASLVGAILGLILGYQVFPTLIFNAYGSMYNIPDVLLSWYPRYTVISLIVALVCTVGSALVVLRVDLLANAAILLRPKAPKPGKRILLERMGPVWRRLSFIQKVTARNLFRYKLRMTMTVLGIAGCMAMIITGFGLRDSIADIVNIQFDKIFHYQALVTLDEDISQDAGEQVQKDLAKLTGYQDDMAVSAETMQATGGDVTNQDLTVYVPAKPENIADFVLFNDRISGEKYQLTNDGAIINEKLAKLYDLKPGDTLTLKQDQKTYPIKVAHIAENYTMHFVYLTPDYYQSVFGKEPVYNSQFLLLKEQPTKKEEAALSEEIMQNKDVANVTFMTQMGSALNDTLNSLNVVIWVLILSAGMLAFIVLYNLTNINISERIRELSTIKVLGFYDKEVTAYIYRENIVLTFLGIFVGCLLGKLLHGFVLNTAEVDAVMFSPQIHWLSYLYSALLTILFTLIVMVMMHLKLKKVDMIEALKSNE